MIFAHTLENVLTSKKSQTRRLVKPGETLCISDTVLGKTMYVEVPGKRKVYEVGKSYAVQPGRGKKSVARITIIGLKRERVLDITTEDACAEGFSSRNAFLETWKTIHGANADLSVEVWVISFKLETIVADEFKLLYERNLPTNQSIDHSHDVSSPLKGLSGTGVHSRDHRTVGVGAAVSD